MKRWGVLVGGWIIPVVGGFGVGEVFGGQWWGLPLVFLGLSWVLLSVTGYLENASEEVASVVALDEKRIQSTAEKAYDRCQQAKVEMRAIDHATARTVAEFWARLWEPADYAFYKTGEITIDPTQLWDQMSCAVSYTTSYQHRMMLDMLGSYLTEREDRGPIEGWEQLAL
jgi:hypothetical protein